MTPLSVIPPTLRVEDTCDFCFRSFARIRGVAPTCPNCGLGNPRQDVAPARRLPALESAMIAPQAESAVLDLSAPRPAKRPPPRKGRR